MAAPSTRHLTQLLPAAQAAIVIPPLPKVVDTAVSQAANN